MAKKISPAELKKQGAELSKQVAEIRKKDHNFAMVMGKDMLAFVTDRKKNPDVLWRTAKSEAGGAKGAKGSVSMSGKVMVLDADDPDGVPRPLLKMAKKHFAERGLPMRIVLKGVEEEDDAAEPKSDDTPQARQSAPEEPVPEQAPKVAPETGAEPKAAPATDPAPDPSAEPKEDKTAALRKSLMDDFKALRGDLDLAAQSFDPGVAKKVGTIARMFVDQIKTDVKKAHSVMGLLQSTIKSARDAGKLDPAPAPMAKDNSARLKKLAELENGVDQLLERLG